MEYKIFGKTGLRVSSLCLGTMTFGSNFYNIGAVDQNLADQIVAKSLEAGINFIDTADVYSYGESEIILGKSLKNLSVNREKVVIATKVKGAMSKEALQGTGDLNNVGLSKKHIIEACNNSLKRLGTDYIDLYQIHGVDLITSLLETLEALDILVKQGKIIYIGCSNLASRHIMKALAISQIKNLSSFVSLQAYYSLLGRDLEHELLPLCIEENLALMAWSPLSGGFLSGKYTRDNPKPHGARRNEFNFPPIYEEKAYDTIDVLLGIAKARNASPAQVALSWLLHQRGVTSVIIGASKMNQLEDNLKAADLKLTKNELDMLSEVSAVKEIYPNWMITRQNVNRT
jgi:aryl-alcohol dehydrogenase-like predicted oxidoreductase